jgi:hypothetical protein
MAWSKINSFVLYHCQFANFTLSSILHLVLSALKNLKSMFHCNHMILMRLAVECLMLVLKVVSFIHSLMTFLLGKEPPSLMIRKLS